MCTWFSRLIQSNSGVSSKSFFLVVITIVAVILLLVPAICMLIEVCYNKTISTDLNGMAAYIASVAGLITGAGICKAWSEKYENRSPKNNSEVENYEC